MGICTTLLPASSKMEKSPSKARQRKQMTALGQHCLHSRGTGGFGQQFQAPLAAVSDGIQDRHTI